MYVYTNIANDHGIIFLIHKYLHTTFNHNLYMIDIDAMQYVPWTL